jgi:hypothetical protein
MFVCRDVPALITIYLAVAFSVTYVAEHHENLHHILVFLTVAGATPGVDLEAEVLPAGGDADSAAGGDYLVVKSGPHTSLPLCLPGRTSPGKKQIRVQSGHYEIKLSTLPNNAPSDTNAAPLLDATQLSTVSPTSFICASCSLPLVQSTKILSYKDLPSDHWEELVDAWMCHSDQKLNEHVMKHGKGGFWPAAGQALVGGSYILFEENSMVKNHLCPSDETKVCFISVLLFFLSCHRANKKTGVGFLPAVVRSVTQPLPRKWTAPPKPLLVSRAVGSI